MFHRSSLALKMFYLLNVYLQKIRYRLGVLRSDLLYQTRPIYLSIILNENKQMEILSQIVFWAFNYTFY